MRVSDYRLFVAFLAIGLPVSAQQEIARVEGGRFLPMYGSVKEQMVEIKTFEMDKKPVTNSEFLAFVKENPKWRKSKVPRLFADEAYLKNWQSDLSFSQAIANAPVTNVSWFAAKAYCECQGKRLPTTNEWEFAAMAGYKQPDERKDSLYTARILAAYETPKTYLKAVGQNQPNYWGIYDLNELVWEWTSDFASIMISGENRDQDQRSLFCGAGSQNATDLMNYAAFMRYAFRNSIQAKFTITNLGFRCVKSADPAM